MVHDAGEFDMGHYGTANTQQNVPDLSREADCSISQENWTERPASPNLGSCGIALAVKVRRQVQHGRNASRLGGPSVPDLSLRGLAPLGKQVYLG